MAKINIDYSKWVSENLDKTINYTEYLAGNVADGYSHYIPGEPMSEKHYQRQIKIGKLINSFKDDEIKELEKEIELLKNEKN